jgi:GntR family transcriptional regulator
MQMMDETPGFRPLYRQVYEFFVKQLVDGAWKPGESLPSEQALAVQLRVSQGTVRKALDTLAKESLVERRQGKGTVVSVHTQEAALFRFFRIARADGQDRGMPTSTDTEVDTRRANDAESDALDLPASAKVYEVKRTRLIDNEPVVFETVVVSAARFPGLGKIVDLPNALYQLYQHRYDVNVVSAEERLRADLAGAEDAKRLKLKKGTPILHIERVALGLDGARVEYRISRTDTRNFVYTATLK